MWTKMILLSVFCVVLSLEFGVATPQGNRFEQSRLQNEGNNEFNVEQNTGEPTNPYIIPNNENEPMPQENKKKILMDNEDYENLQNDPPAYKNVNEQPSVISDSKEYNQNTAQRNFNTLNNESLRPSYIASLPQVNRIQAFRPKDGVNREANMPRMVDILSEVNNPKNDLAPIDSNPTIIQEKNSANQIMNKYNRQNSQTTENFNDKKEEEDTTQVDVPVATPEYIKSLFEEYKQTKKNNVKPTITNSPKNYISNKNFQTNSQNVNEATFQNPSAEILYETGQAKPYEISNEPLHNTRQGPTNPHNILKDKQRLKNLYLSSKPTKHYMIVYPDGRVEQVDKLDKIQKIHPKYVMLNAKELLQHDKPNTKVASESQGSVVKQNLPTNNMKLQSNSIKDTKDNQINKVPQAVTEQNLPVPIEPFPIATEPPITATTEGTETNNVEKSSNDEVLKKFITEQNVQNQLQESVINDSQDKNNLNNDENTTSGAIVTGADNSNIQVSTTSTTDNPSNEDIVTTVRSTISTPTTDTPTIDTPTTDTPTTDTPTTDTPTTDTPTTDTSTTDTPTTNPNISNSLSTSNNTDSSNLSKEPEDSNSTPGGNLISTKDDSVVAENTTPIPKQESNEENETTKITTTITSDQNTIQEDSNTTESIETSNVNYETNTSNSSLVSSVNKEESNLTTKSINETVITSEDSTDSDGNTFHAENINTNDNYESSAQNARSYNVTSSNNSTLVTNSNETDIANSSTENTENNMSQLNFTSSNSLTKKEVNSTDTKTIQIVSNVTNSEVDETKNDDNNLKPYNMDASSNNTSGEANDVSSTQEESNLNKTLSTNIKQDGSKNTDAGTDDSDDLSTENADMSNEEDGNTASDASNDYQVITLGGGAVSSNEENSTAPGTDSSDSDYLNSPQNGVYEDDADDDTKKETRPETTNTSDNVDTESSSDENIVNESSFWFNANESFWQKLMNSNEHNSLYFLFPRPQPKTKETKKIVYPNGTVVIETTEIIDNGDDETTPSKTVVTCENCTTSEKTL